MKSLATTSITSSFVWSTKTLHAKQVAGGVVVDDIRSGEDIFSYLRRTEGRVEISRYRGILGAANEFKEGDEIVGVSTASDECRRNARQLLANSTLEAIEGNPPWEDDLSRWIQRFVKKECAANWRHRTLGELKSRLLNASEDEIKGLIPGLSSDVIACLVRLMSNAELISIGQKVFHTLGNSQIGSRGYLGARIQPNSPTDHPDDIRFQVFDAFSYGVGDVLLGTNPVSSDPRSVAVIERALQDILTTFEVDDVIPHCVLSHIDVQAEVERVAPGATAFWFQSIAGNDDANTTFDITVEKMAEYARSRVGRYGLYLETGQGSDFTNGHGHGSDMVIHEARKYGLARGLAHEIANAKGVKPHEVWLHLNDVAGFIGPEVFRTREQLVRCCLEDIVMGKLHGLTIGLDVCATLHMDLTLNDLDWCLDQIAPANPAYLMALPTKIDPMLGYLTTGYHDHVRLRQKYGYQVDNRMRSFFEKLGVIDPAGNPTEHFGDPNWVYLQYCRRKHDDRTDDLILTESRKTIAAIRQRGVFIAEGSGHRFWELAPTLRSEIQTVFDDAKQCIWKEWDPEFIKQIPNSVLISTQSTNRTDFILHPATGERLAADSERRLQLLRTSYQGKWNTVLVVSEGLNALALMDEGQLKLLMDTLVPLLERAGLSVASERFVVANGRVRAGYRIGELLFADLPDSRNIIHLIGERPGSGHHTLSAYVTTAFGTVWGKPNQVDHNITKVISGIAVTALAPQIAAEQIAAIIPR